MFLIKDDPMESRRQDKYRVGDMVYWKVSFGNDAFNDFAQELKRKHGNPVEVVGINNNATEASGHTQWVQIKTKHYPSGTDIVSGFWFEAIR